ncbi:hypothetical protein Goari_022176 [Gossypium aridum]|uniref:Uncharacterized protein n=1 Tax=Gossypium aridum TaxID=34290 RepID=A0A7J8YT89_GOSAI|nr:hypothetical protein [Gossypium aridum]
MNDVETLFGDRVRDGEGTIVDRNTKKFRFKERYYSLTENMVVDSAPVSGVTWQDKLLGGSGSGSLNGATILNLEFEDGDILRFFINGIPDIDFSDRLKKILVKYMESTIVVKLLGHNIYMEAQMADMGAPSKGLGNIRFNKVAFLKNLKGKGLELRNGLAVGGKLDEGQLGHSEEINQGFWGRFTLGRSWGHLAKIRCELKACRRRVLNCNNQQDSRLSVLGPSRQWDFRRKIVSHSRLVQKYPTASISLPKDKATSLHENPTFEGRHRVKVNLIANVLDLKRYTIVTFMENLDNNSKSKMGKGLLMAHRNPSSISRGHGVESRKENGHNGKSIIKSICRHGERFKPTGSSRVSL